MKAPTQYPEAQSFIDALVQPFDSEAGRVVAEPFDILWSDAIPRDKGLDTYHVMAPPLGIHFTFDHEGVVFDRPYEDDGKGPHLLTSCAFWGTEDGYESYKGPIWKGLTFSDTIADAEAKLGPPTRVNRHGIHAWALPDFKLTMQWKNPNAVRVISYWMNRSEE
jgi:hypothetical protein